MTGLRPPFPYYGAKTRLAPRIAALLPPHQVYLEPFFGSGAVLFAKRPSAFEAVNDLDHNVVTFFRMLRDHPDDFIRACELTPYAQAEFDAADLTDPALDDLERARRFWLRCCQGFSAHVGRGGWSYSTVVQRGTSRATDTIGLCSRMRACARRLRSVAVTYMPAVQMIAKYGQDPDTVIYADPPYLGTTRRIHGIDYDHDLTSEAEHRALADALRTTNATVLLSGYTAPLYDELYAGWERVTATVHQPAANGDGRSRHGVEVIWSNRPLGRQGVLDLTTPTTGGTP